MSKAVKRLTDSRVPELPIEVVAEPGAAGQADLQRGHRQPDDQGGPVAEEHHPEEGGRRGEGGPAR